MKGKVSIIKDMRIDPSGTARYYYYPTAAQGEKVSTVFRVMKHFREEEKSG